MEKIKLQIKGDDLKKKLGLKDGDQGAKGDRGEKGDKGDRGDIGPKGDRGEPGKDGITLKAPTSIEIAQQIPIRGYEVRDSLELLSGEERLDASAIKNLPEATEKIIEKVNAPGRGLHVYVEGEKKGLLNTIDFVGMVHSKSNGRDTLTVTDEKVKLNALDSTEGYLDNKIIAYGILAESTQNNTMLNGDLTIKSGQKIYLDGD